MSKLNQTVSALVLLIGAGGVGSAWAGNNTVFPVVATDIAPPATKLVEAPLVSPSAAAAYYGGSLTHTVGVTGSGKDAPEIKAIAASLLGNKSLPADQAAFVQNVFDYVRNNIDTEFRYGLSKGALGALVDESGTPFDQADLMVALLAAGGVNASFQTGTISVTADSFGQWTGLGTSVNAAAVCRLLADGGIPATVNGSSSCTGQSGTLAGNSTIVMSHIWVVVGSTAYDPSYKQYALKTGINLASSMGCASSDCGVEVKSALGGTETTESVTVNSVGYTIPYLTAYNPSAVSTKVAAFGAQLATNIRNSNPDMLVTDVVGGRELMIQTTGPTPATYVTGPTWTAVPNQYRTILSVKVTGQIGPNGVVCNAFYADDIGGRELTIAGMARLDNDYINTLSYTSAIPAFDTACPTVQASLNESVPYLTLSVDHPYAASSGTYADETSIKFKPVDDPFYETGIYRPFDLTNPSNIYNPDGTYFDDPNTFDPSDYPEKNFLGNGPITIIHGFGQAHMSAVRRAENYKTVADFITTFPCAPTTNARVQDSSCNLDDQVVIAAKINAYRTLTDRMIDGVSGTVATRHHDLGYVYSSRTPNLARMSLQESLSVSSKTATDADRQAAFETHAITLSEVEGATSPNEIGVPMSFSTMFLGNRFTPMTGASQTSGVNTRRIYDITPGNMAGFLGIMGAGAHTGGAPILKFDSCPTFAGVLSTCYRAQQLADIAAKGYSTIIPEGGEAEIFYKGTNERAYTVWEYMKGGSAVSDPLATVTKTTDLVDAASIRRKSTSVAMVDGSLSLQASPDIVTGTGSFPESLPFIRTYAPASWERANYQYVKYLFITGGPAGGGQASKEGARLDSSSIDAQYNDRLGGGWVHNYQVFLGEAHEPAVQFGVNFGLDAALVVARIKSVFDLSKSSDLTSRVARAVAVTGMSASSDINVKQGASSQSFHWVAGLGYYSHSSPNATVVANTGGCSDMWTCPVWTYTGEAGDVISFSRYYNSKQEWNPQTGNMAATSPIGRWSQLYKADNWTFPTGVSLTFNYTKVLLTPPNSQTWYPCSPLSLNYGFGSGGNPATGGTPGVFTWTIGTPCQTVAYLPVGMVLSSVQNNLGRQLSFTTARIYTYGYSFKIAGIKDESLRTVSFDYGGCASFTCPYFSVTDPNGLTTRYEYVASTEFPDGAKRVQPNYVLRRWYTPSDTTKPYQEMVYDDLFRVKKIRDRSNAVTTYFPGAVFGGEIWKRSESLSPMNELGAAVFNEKNNQIYARSPMGREVQQQFDKSGRLIKQTLPEGNGAQYTYNIRGDLVATRAFSKTCGPAATSCADDIIGSKTYGEPDSVLICANRLICHSPVTETDPLGNVKTYTWDAATGLMTRVVGGQDRAGGRPQTDLTYSTAANGMKILTNKRELVSSKVSGATVLKTVDTGYGYYGSGGYYALNTTVDDSGGQNLTSTLSYDTKGNLISVDGPLPGSGDTTTYQWDTGRRLMAVISPDPDGAGPILRKMVKYTYNGDGLVTRTDTGTSTAADGSNFAISSSQLVEYDKTGNKTKVSVTKP